MYLIFRNCSILLAAGILALSGCTKSKPDFTSMPKYDAHVHIYYPGAGFLEQAKADNFKAIVIILDAYDLAWSKQYVEQQKKLHGDRFDYVTSFTMQGWDEPDWQEKTIAFLKSEFENGAIGVKVWKNIGMEFKDKNGRFVMIDNTRFDPIFDFIESQGKVLTGHIGEPRDCWLPLEKMIAAGNKNYYRGNPQYHMYLHPAYPSYDEQIQSYQRMLDKHPNLKYIGCHLGSIEWSMTELAKVLDKYPNMAVDLAARVDDIQLLDRTEVKTFLINYQDRVLYATDYVMEDNQEPEKAIKRIHERWLSDWTYFATDSVTNIRGTETPVRGLNLPETVLNKIYRQNVEKWYLKKL